MAVQDPRKLPGSMGLESLFRGRAKEYSLDIAGDGYVIACDPDASEEHRAKVRQALSAGSWHACRSTDCLGECTASGCSCSRSINPTARDGFRRHVVQRFAEVAAGKAEVSYASLGCGLLRFDFELLEALLAAQVPVTAVHLVDPQYDGDAKGNDQHRAALGQFAAWFVERNVDIYAHTSMEKFAFHVRQAQALPLVVLQVDCSELTWIFDSQVQPMLEEVLFYGGLFCALTAREGAAQGTSSGATDAWGEVWRLVPESGRLRTVSRLRFRPGEPEGRLLDEDERMPPAVGH
mmetsp:Transcript_88317/g.224817  ORF Transcript_88317/g.224817 Transcript_88317/m.224817 type:complete len:292 (-) Transcript_88317:166-1041(-)